MTDPFGLADRLARLGVDGSAPLVVALSGGPDSLALALATRDMSQNADRAFAAAVVDHRMRDGSAQEALAVKAQAEALGIPATVLTLPPGLSSMASARAARYQALAAFANGRSVLVGQHHDDQLETVALRLEKRSGWRGLAGMSATASIEGARIVRPLLNLTKQQLRDDLAARGISWIDDPSNHKRRFRRVYLRQLLTQEPALSAALTELQAVHARLRRWVEDRAVALLDQSLDPRGERLFLRADALLLDPLVRTEIFRRAVEAVSGRFDCCLDPNSTEALPTGSGCVFHRCKSGVEIVRDPRVAAAVCADDSAGAHACLSRAVFSIV